MKHIKTWLMSGVVGLGFSASIWGATDAIKGEANDVSELVISSKPISAPKPSELFFERARAVSTLFAVNSVVVVKDIPTGAPTTNIKSEQTREQLLRAMMAENKTLTIEALMKCIDSRVVTDASTRKGALKAIELTGFQHPTLSKYIASTAVVDPEKEVRATAVSTIKNRKDETAMNAMTGYLMSSYDEAGKVLDANLKDNAVEALRNLGDKRVYQSLLYYATCEIRATQTELASFATRQIDATTVLAGAVPVVIPLSFPIQFPELKITKVRTTVKCPAVNALESLSGQAFGEDLERWEKWITKQK